MFIDDFQKLKNGTMREEDLFSRYDCRFDALPKKATNLMIKAGKVIEYAQLDISKFKLSFQNIKFETGEHNIICFDTENRRMVINPKLVSEDKDFCEVALIYYPLGTCDDEIETFKNWRTFQRAIHEDKDLKKHIKEFLNA